MSLADTIAQFTQDAAAYHQIVHGTSGQTVTTENGQVRSLSKAIATADALAAAAESPRQANYIAGQNSRIADYLATQATFGPMQTQMRLSRELSAAGTALAELDMSAVNSSPMHRSPNNIVATAIYDTSADSDGGAWTQKVDASYLYETLYGAWLASGGVNGLQSELAARMTNATLGTEINPAPNGDFTGWIPVANASVVGGKLTINTTITSGTVASAPAGVGNLSAGVYRISMTVESAPAGSGGVSANILTSPMMPAPSVGTFVDVISVTGTGTLNVIARGANAAAGTVVSKISIKQITAFPASTGSYYQLSTDGKFYRLWKNLMKGNAGDFNDVTAWPTKTNTTVTGTIGAQKIVPANLVAQVSMGIAQQVSLFTGMANTFTVEVDATDARYLVLQVDNAGGFACGASFDLQSLTVVTNGHAFFTTGLTGSITASTTPGRLLCQLRFTMGAGLSTGLWWARVEPSTALPVATATSYSVSGNGVNGVPLYQTQVEYATAFTSFETKGVADGSQTEVFRGNIARFPRVAGIVAEAARIVIYDLLAPGQPMWMVLQRGGTSSTTSNMLGSTSVTLSGLAGLNGVLAVSDNASAAVAYSLFTINFANDSAVCNRPAAGAQIRYAGSIAQRNDGKGWVVTSLTNIIANGTVNAVSMALMRDAPVDPATGLLIPTIAAGTAGGASIIKHDGTVVNSSSTSNFSHVDITPDILTIRATSPILSYVLAPGTATAAFVAISLNQNAAPSFQGASTVYGNVSTMRTAHRSLILMSQVFGTDPNGRVGGLRLNEITPGASLAFGMTNAYNTGWMVGDIRRSLLCETTAGSITGANLVTTGDFAVDANWTKGTGWTIAAGKATKTPGTASLLEQTGYTFVVGQKYEVIFTISGRTAGAVTIRVGNNTLNATGNFIANGVQSAYVTVTNILTQSLSVSADAVFDGSIDDISIRVAIDDRTYKVRGVGVYGTLTKTAAATGTQMVTYGGFSSTNYLQEQPSTDLDFGTAGFDVMAWATLPAMTISSGGQFTLPTSSFNAVGAPLSIAMNTANWTKGTGWTCPTASTFTSDGTQVAQSDLQWITGSALTAGGLFRKWTITITAVTGTGLTVFPNSSSPVGITATGTYTLFGDGNASTLLRVAAGVTVTGSLVVEDVAPAMLFSRSAASGAKFELGVSPFGVPMGIVSDGTTVRTVSQGTVNSGGVSYAGIGMFLIELSLSSTGAVTLRVNGAQTAQTTGAALLTMNNTSAVFNIGQNFALTAPFPGGIALVRVSATIPSSDNVLWMFPQEKLMFQPGAQVTLPDSGAPVDISYDALEDAWKVVSSTNEAKFVGLVRVSTAPVPAGSFLKVSQVNGIRLVARSTSAIGADVSFGARTFREELFKKSSGTARTARAVRVFDFDAIAAQTDFVLPTGWTALEVVSGGAGKREGSTKDWTRLYDGFRETVRFATAPGAAVWVQIIARQF